MSQNTSHARIVERLAKVCEYIDHHLDDELNVETLCDVAHFSKYHFHRQFSAMMGISVYQYIQQIRLKRAAYQLVFNSQLTILDIALQAGFEHPESFNRAFKKRYLQSPSKFRLHPDWDSWHQQHHHIEFRKEITMDVVVKRIEEIPVAVIEHHGSPTRVMETVAKFITWRKTTGLSPITQSRSFGIVYHDPKSVPAEEFRFDVAGEIDTPIPEDNAFGIVNKTIRGGRYAVARHVGSRDAIGDTVYYLYQQWLPQHDEEPNDAPIFFHYMNLYPEVPEHELLTDVYLPIAG